MSIIYVRSTDGSDSDNGSTWALAKATLAGAAAIDAAGDTIYVSQVHAETTASTVTFAWAGTLASPTKVIGANDGAEPPTATSNAPTFTTTGGNIGLGTGSVYYRGIGFICNTGAAGTSIGVGGAGITRFESCQFFLSNTNAGSISTGAVSTSTRVVFESCDFKFNIAGHKISVSGDVQIKGGSFLSGGTSPTTVFDFNNLGSLTVTGFDFSNCAAGVILVSTVGAGTTIPYRARFIDCKLPASWSGSPQSSAVNSGAVVEMINCSAGAVNYAYWRQTFGGDIKHETTIVKGSGASDGTTPLSWKCVSNANAIYPLIGLESEDIYAWNNTVGSSVTATVEIVTDNVTLKNNEAYLELFYLSSTSAPIATRINNEVADVLTTAVNQSTSTVTWTTTGLTTPVKQKLSVTFTPQMVGFIVGRVVLIKPSTTVYVDPVLTLT